MRLDTHQHFWELAKPFTDWPTPDLAAIHRDFGPEDLSDQLDALDIDGTILVQAAPSVAESEYCLSIAARCDFVRGVIGWIDFEAADVMDQFDRMAQDPLLKGLRPMVQSIKEPGWLLRDAFTSIFEAMVARGLRLDGLVCAHQLGDLYTLGRRHPALPIVLNHAGKPPISAGTFDKWAVDMAQLAENPSLHCKLSGLWTEAGDDVAPATIAPWVDHLLVTFGSERLMWGSDWPVIELAGSYSDWLGQCEALLAGLTPDQRAAIFGGNGMRFYDID